MISFNNDYSEGAHPRILQYLLKYNLEQNDGYGEDIHSSRAKELIRNRLGTNEVDIHLIPGGTQTNLIVISSFLRPHQAVIAADTAHINVHETGAIEATGHKVIALPCKEGKLSPTEIRAALEYHESEHMVQPKLVYLSNSTELGTIYSKAELTAIRELCNEKGLYLYLDGARLASAISCPENDLSLQDIVRLTDAFYIGGTKNGAMLGEALVIGKAELKEDFRYYIKQRGALMAKGFIIGLQFEALFEDNLYFELSENANSMARRLAEAFTECGFSFYVPVYTNQLFPILPDRVIDVLSKSFRFQKQVRVDEVHCAVRFVTSWATTEESVNELRKALKGVQRC
jgi:threonine aldolase